MSETNPDQDPNPELSSRQREWLTHFKRCEASGKPMKTYAKENQLSIHTMYQAIKVLRQKGVLPPTTQARRKRNTSFVRVSVPQTIAASWSVRFSSGAVLEGSGALSSELLASLVEVLSTPR